MAAVKCLVCERDALMCSNYCEQHAWEDVRMVEYDPLTIRSVWQVCGAILIIAASGSLLLAPLALVLYLISWWGCR